MKVDVDLNGQRVTVEISSTGVSIDGRHIACDWIRVGEGRYSLILDGRVFDLSATSADGHFSVAGREGAYLLSVTDPNTYRASSEAGDAGQGPRQLRADMPGKVIRLLVRDGDSVASGQALLVLEAMKMQNEIRSPKAGLVRGVTVEPGRTVNSGDLLVTIE